MEKFRCAQQIDCEHKKLPERVPAVKWCGTIRQTPVLEKILTAAPPRFFQLETGVQTFNADVAGRVHRQSDAEKIEQNIRNSVHLHADFIAGLLGETFASIAAVWFRRDQSFFTGEGNLFQQLGVPSVLLAGLLALVYCANPPRRSSIFSSVDCWV